MVTPPRLRLVDTSVTVCQFHVLLHGVNPPVWRRILMRGEHTLTDLHYAILIAFDWSNVHLHTFKIRCKGYADWRSDLAGEKDTDRFRLGEFRFRPRERFLYEYDFTDGWKIQVRFEKALPLEAGRRYPVCIGGSRAAPIDLDRKTGGEEPDNQRSRIEQERRASVGRRRGRERHGGGYLFVGRIHDLGDGLTPDSCSFPVLAYQP